MFIILILRLAFTKSEKDPAHKLSSGHIWYDRYNGSGQGFFDYTIANTNIPWFEYCKDKNYGPDRTIVALAPSGNALVNLVKSTLDKDLALAGLTTQVYESREAIMKVVGSSSYEKDGKPGICFGAALVESDDAANKYQLNMLFDDTSTERTQNSNMPNQELEPADEYQRAPNTDAYERYRNGGYTYLQNIFANAILRTKTANSGAYISMINTPMKTSRYNDDDFALAATNMWNFFILLIFLAPLYRFVSNSVAEKETKMREAMKIMGLKDTPYWLSWFSYYITINTIQCIAMILILIPVFEYSNRFIVFVHLWLYGMTMFAYGVFIGAFFSSGKTAAIVATMFFYLTSFINIVVADRTVSEGAKVVTSFFPAVAMQLAGTNLLQFEAAGTGLTSDNSSELYYNYRFSTAIWMNVLCFFVFFFLGLYLENVLPSAVGVRKPLWFPFMKSYWCSSSEKQEHHNDDGQDLENRGSNRIGNSNDADGDDSDKREIDPENFEEIPDNLRRKEEQNEYIKITHLRKRFDKGFYAINDLNAEMFEDEIFALLGHNGAGKTTTMNVLCGMMAASTGKATIYGYDIKTQMKEIRKMMGYCPQHNILFPKLTVKEHLSIFADFKGMPTKEINAEIDQLLKDLNLENKKHVLSKNLSGGYKRKLSLGIALIGGSKVVFLDEPSSGMDVTARREMWDMLKKYKNDRIIILTTHYMEEADNLGDRIGIMSHGQMLCCGSPDFLKNKFGEGYNLVVVKTDRSENQQLESFIINNVPGSSKVSEVSSEATYLLPKASSNYFGDFFRKFDKELSNLGVSSYGVSMTTLEEVFLKVESGDAHKDAEAVEKLKRRLTSNIEENKGADGGEYSISKEQISGTCNVFWLHFYALIIKRLILSKRNFKGFLIDLLIPILLIIAGFGLATIEFFKDSDPRLLEPSLFPLPQRVIYNTNVVSGAGSPATLIGLLDPPGSFQPTPVTATAGSSSSETLQNFDNTIYNAAQTDPLKPYRYGHYYFHTLDFTNHQYKIVTFVNITSQEATVAFPQFMYQAVLRRSINNNLSFKAVNDPMPIAQILKDRDKSSSGFFTGFVLGIAFALIPTSIIGFILHERMNQLIHQQTISGMNKTSYWISNYLFDLVKVFVVVLVTIAFLYIYDLDFPYAWLLLLLFPTALVPYTYVTSFLFSDESAAQNFTIIHNFLIGGLLPILMNVLRIIKSTRTLGDGLIWIGRFIPSYCLCGGIINISLRDTIATSRKEEVPEPLSGKVAGGDVAFLVIHFFFWSLMLFLIEVGCFNCLRKKGSSVHEEYEVLDDDVVKEQQRVENTSEKQLAVKANHLRKVYDKHLAVKDISFGLEFGDCFCLLGVNGAGKTTTFKMLTNDVVPTKGQSHIVGYNVRTQFANARKQIGYCPQFDAIFNLLTVREHLEFYARIKKIPRPYVEGLIKEQLKSMNLEQYENKKAGTLSGGNKRKLSVAMAMLGNPPVVFLDEPSAGMDPKARRFMWEVIARISTRGKNSAVILTTHSMEEAEALSTNMGIMVAGQFKCFGSKQHIKNKFGVGYQVEIKFRMPKTEAVKEQIESLKLLNFLRDSHSSFQIQNRKGEEVIMVDKKACIAILEKVLNNMKAIDEFHIEGFGKEIVESLDEHGYYPVAALIKWEYVMRHNWEALSALVAEFGSAKLLEQYAPRYRYRVPKGDKSVGYFFSFMETLKQKLDVDEYSASQTTLEQIFNGFARLADQDVVQREFSRETMGMRNANRGGGTLGEASYESSTPMTKSGKFDNGKNYNGKRKDPMPKSPPNDMGTSFKRNSSDEISDDL